MQRKEIIEKELSSYEGRNFLLYQSRNGQGVAEMAHQVREIFAENNLSIAEAKGFLDYMKLIVEFSLCTSGSQENNKKSENTIPVEEQKKTGKEKEERNPGLSEGEVFTQAQRRVLGIKSRSEDEWLMIKILNMFRRENLPVDRASRILTDAQTMLPKVAKVSMN